MISSTVPGWKVTVWPSRPARGGQVEDSSGQWSLSRARRVSIGATSTTLYDLEVFEDHSFVVDGLIAHNSGGPGDIWSSAMIDAYQRVAAAMAWGSKHGSEFVCAHKEWAPGRKPDPYGVNMSDFRRAVKQHLGSPPAPVNPAAVFDDAAPRMVMVFVSSYDLAGGPHGWPTLKVGSTGEHVRLVQGSARWLTGESIDIDGVYGPVTKDVVTRIQRLASVTQDGVCGFRTYQVFRFFIHVKTQETR